MSNSVPELQRRFQQQHAFSLTYSPLYAAFFGTIAGWLGEPAPGPVVPWLLDAAEGRAAFDVTNLLAAAVHREVLAGAPAATSLSSYYPTVGGSRTAGSSAAGDFIIDLAFQDALATLILSRRAALRDFIQRNTVQTNETGRGLAWLLPTAVGGFDAFHLLDLGASAGLNLVAETRRFDLQDGQGRELARLGHGRVPEFSVGVSGWPASLAQRAWPTPRVLSRLGGDLHPFLLATDEDERTLAAFVWADQVGRLRRLQSGIRAFHTVNSSLTAVQLHELELPAGLPVFLEQFVRAEDAPVICYNTYVRMYLPDKGAALRDHLAAWARAQARPVVWLQWEPPSCLLRTVGQAPEPGWLAWTADLWHGGIERRWLLGWVHPHGQDVALGEGFEAWISFWNS